MKKFLLVVSVLSLFLVGCSKVPAGNVGIKFHLYGTNKGVDYETLKPGRYWIGMNEELYTFPTFTQNITWTKDHDKGEDDGDQSFNFQDKQGLELNADIGASYHIDPAKVTIIFQKYKKGIDEITDIFLRNMVRDALVSRSSILDVEQIYGEGRTGLIDSVKKDVKGKCDSIGIVIEELYWIGRIKVPTVVKNAIDAKIQATQIAQQRENELRQAEAEAKKKIAEAEGEAQANKIKMSSLTPQVIEWQRLENERKAIESWNGQLPTVTSGVTPFIQLK